MNEAVNVTVIIVKDNTLTSLILALVTFITNLPYFGQNPIFNTLI